MSEAIGFDAVNWRNIPRAAIYVYGYANGRISQWPAIAWNSFPGAHLARIDVDGSMPHADELDVERYDATPTTASEWVHEKLDLKGPRKPSIYCNRSTRPVVKTILAENGLTAGVHYGFRIATLDGTRTVEDMNEVIAVQTTDNGDLYDENIIYQPDWFTSIAHPVERYQIVAAYPAWNSTLWGIAAHYYGDGNQYTKIYDANRQIIGNNPANIKPGMNLLIP